MYMYVFIDMDKYCFFMFVNLNIIYKNNNVKTIIYRNLLIQYK